MKVKFNCIFSLLLFLFASATTVAQTPCEDCPLTPACCEDDCCGAKTSWSLSVRGCISDPSSDGWTGVSLPGYVEGCALRTCCEEGCCKNGTFFNISQAFCVPLPNGGAPTPSPTESPTSSAIPTAAVCEPLFVFTQTAFDGSAVAVSAPTSWRFIRDPSDPDATVPDDRRGMDWIYDWKKNGQVSGNLVALLEDQSNRGTNNNQETILPEKIRCDIADECNRKVGTYQKALCAAKKISKHFKDPKTKNGDCKHNSAALLSVLKKMNIPGSIEVSEKKDLNTGESTFHCWVEVYVGERTGPPDTVLGFTYILDPLNDLYVCLPNVNDDESGSE